MKRILILFLALVCTFTLFSCKSTIVTNDASTDRTTDRTTDRSTNGTTDDSTNHTTNGTTDDSQELFSVENGKRYLVLPISKQKVRIRSDHESKLEQIDRDMLKAAEQMITDDLSAYTDAPVFYLEINGEGHLCLAAECIVDINPPNVVTDENGYEYTKGCNIDHKHVFLLERITK